VVGRIRREEIHHEGTKDTKKASGNEMKRRGLGPPPQKENRG
jgi:hypothetical protein